ncbi:Phenazine biosynthesis PhzC/PhzF protein [alpha proteobacterium BAL199]|jgi:trans-2,3-dihydro-3-hydroxyanthranilate isomerase|nr:Phenazine biosynthesis PhzC/PhzF protein [alpha proteobacterium BAL199]
MTLTYETVDVFTDVAFGGNPLAVVFGAEGLSAAAMQAIAREFNYSETTFVLPPQNPAHTARVRIFTPNIEVPFAGHPNVGTATVLAWRDKVFDRPIGDRMVFEETAGLVPVAIIQEGGRPVGATLTAPQPFQRLGEADATEVAACLGLRPSQIREGRHQPVTGTVGLPFLLVELTDRAALEAARPVTSAILSSPSVAPVKDIHCYVRTGNGDDVDLRTRMFAPLDGVPEDPATGSANCALAGLLAELDGPADGTIRLRIAQGVEMGRPSLLLAEADRTGGVTTAIRIGGRCVAIRRGEIVAG